MEPRVFLNGIIIIVTTDVLGPERELGNHYDTETRLARSSRNSRALESATLYRLVSDRITLQFFHALDIIRPT